MINRRENINLTSSSATYPLNLLVQGPSWTPQLLHGEGDASLIPTPVLVTNDKKKEAYVTMITSNDIGFIAGALVSGSCCVGGLSKMTDTRQKKKGIGCVDPIVRSREGDVGNDVGGGKGSKV